MTKLCVAFRRKVRLVVAAAAVVVVVVILAYGPNLPAYSVIVSYGLGWLEGSCITYYSIRMGRKNADPSRKMNCPSA